MTYSTDNARNFLAALAILLITEVFSHWRWSPAAGPSVRDAQGVIEGVKAAVVAQADAAHAGALFVFGYLAAAPIGAAP